LVDSVYLFDLASRHAAWASVRQSALTSNVANANTANYQRLDVEPFSDVLDETSLRLASTAPGHLGIDGNEAQVGGAQNGDNWEIKETGGAVKLESELIEADAVNRGYALDTSVVRAFHRMLLTAVRSGS
jgi:flagellar basal-body rod protein FlgB